MSGMPLFGQIGALAAGIPPSQTMLGGGQPTLSGQPSGGLSAGTPAAPTFGQASSLGMMQPAAPSPQMGAGNQNEWQSLIAMLLQKLGLGGGGGAGSLGALSSLGGQGSSLSSPGIFGIYGR